MTREGVPWLAKAYPQQSKRKDGFVEKYWHLIHLKEKQDQIEEQSKNARAKAQK
jgi:hypothetical protein